MALITWLSTIVPLPVLMVGIPLLIMTSFLLAFQDWIEPPIAAIGMVTLLSLLTGGVALELFGASFPQAVLVGGVVAPAIGGWLLGGLGAARRLQQPWAAQTQTNYRPRRSIVKTLTGAFAGSVLGLATGEVLSLLLLGDHRNSFAPLFWLTQGISLLLGSVGLAIGFWLGSGRTSPKQFRERLLISGVVYGMWFVHLLKRPIRSTRPATIAASAPSSLQVQRRAGELILTYPLYRSFDWVWLRFNGIFDGLALLVLLLAGWQHTWNWSLTATLLLGILWTGYSLTRLRHQTKLKLSAAGLSRQRPLLFSFYTRLWLPRQQITAIQGCPQQQIGWSSCRFAIHAVLQNGQHIPLLTQLESWQDVLLLTQQIERFWW